MTSRSTARSHACISFVSDSDKRFAPLYFDLFHIWCHKTTLQLVLAEISRRYRHEVNTYCQCYPPS